MGRRYLKGGNKARGGRGNLSSNWGLHALAVFFNYFYQMVAFLFSERVGGELGPPCACCIF